MRNWQAKNQPQLQRAALKQLLLLLITSLLVSCATLGGKDRKYRQNIYNGDYEAAIRTADKYDRGIDRLLQLMHLSSLQQLQGDYEASNEQLEDGKDLAAELAAISISETAAALTVNERVAKFSGNRFERLMLFFHKALNYLELQDLVAARIELSQAELLLQEWKTTAAAYPFLPLYLGIIYEQLGDGDNALVAYRRSLAAYGGEAAPRLARQLYVDLLAELGRRTELARAESSLGLRANPATGQHAKLVTLSTKGLMTPMSFIYIPYLHPTLARNFQIAVPAYLDDYALPPPPSLNLEGAASVQELGWTTLIDVEEQMRQALNQRMAAIIPLALARAVIKSELEQQARQQSQELGFLVLIASTVSEVQVDTRSWDILPQAFYLSYLMAAPGSYWLGDRLVELEPGMNTIYLPGR